MPLFYKIASLRSDYFLASFWHSDAHVSDEFLRHFTPDVVDFVKLLGVADALLYVGPHTFDWVQIRGLRWKLYELEDCLNGISIFSSSVHWGSILKEMSQQGAS